MVVAICKMEMVSIVGPVNDFERVVSEYLTDFDLHIESTLSTLDNVKGLYPFGEDAQGADLLARVQELLTLGGIPPGDAAPADGRMTQEQAAELLARVQERIADNNARLEQVSAALEENAAVRKQLEYMRNVEIDLDELFQFRFIKFRFGRLPRAGYKKLKSYLQDIDAFFVEGENADDYIYGVYFMPAEYEEKIDAIFTSLYFERIMISGDSHGTPQDAYEAFERQWEELQAEKQQLTGQARDIINQDRDALLAAYALLEKEARIATVQKYAAHTRDSFYIIGWAAARDVRKMEKKLQAEPNVVLVVEGADMAAGAPPIKLKNPRLFRPFESFVQMYGLPSYHELDPTSLLAVLYVLMFGIMFGDVGHGLCLAIGGLLYYKWKKADIGAIVSVAGLVSAVFGMLYGSVFGNEELLPRVLPGVVLIQPMHQINTILLATVGLGVGIILLSMGMNLLNALKNRNWGLFWFDQNGIAGVTFYVSVLLLALNMLTGMVPVNKPVLTLLIVLSLLAIYLKEPLGDLVAGKKNWLPKDVGDYLLSSFFEVFEIVLSFATNTISFVRLGAFALAHAGMMSVVAIFANMASGAGSVVVLVIGNVLVMALEGLVVGIQALRLVFYEMFSRFFTGDGRPFVSVKELH